MSPSAVRSSVMTRITIVGRNLADAKAIDAGARNIFSTHGHKSSAESPRESRHSGEQW